MANVLTFVRLVATDPSTRDRLRADATAELTRSDLDDLTGEDVEEALGVVRHQVPPALAERIEDVPASAPEAGETPLDAAVRLLHWVAERTGGSRSPAEASARGWCERSSRVR